MSKDPTSDDEIIGAFERYFEEAEASDLFWIEKAKLRFTEEMLARMQELDLSKGELADRLGVKPAQISRLCTGRNNFEVATMVRIARALECELRTHMQPKGAQTQWIDVLEQPGGDPGAPLLEFPVFGNATSVREYRSL